MNMLEKGVFHIGVGTPGRVKALVEQGRCKGNVFSVSILYLVSWESRLQLFLKCLGWHESVDLGTILYGSVSLLLLWQWNQVKVLVVAFMIASGWHKSVLPEQGKSSTSPSTRPVSAHLFPLPACCASPSLFGSSVNWSQLKVIPIKTKPVCTQNQVMSRQRRGSSSFGRNTDLWWLESDCKTVM